MTEEQQLQLQAFLDGELPEAEAMRVVAWIARDEEAKALHAELKNTRKAIKDSVENIQLPESREFYWSKIQRDIERLETARVPAPSVSLFERLRRVLMPLGAMAALVLAGLFTYHELGLGGGSHSAELDQSMTGSGGFTYRDYSAGMTLVWLPFPAEKDLAQSSATATIQ